MGSFENEYKKLNPAQKQAVDTIDGPVLVIAGPGTGKTQLLTTRVANILYRTDAEPQNILCLTFTETAAYEMRQRLVNMVGQRAYNITISTYHAFGSDLIRRFPDYFTDATDMRPIDELGQHAVMEKILGQLEYSNPLKKASNYVRDVITTISDFKRALLEPQDIQKIALANLEDLENLGKLATMKLLGVVRMSPKVRPLFEELAASTTKYAQTSYIIPGVLSLANLWQLSLNKALEADQLTDWKNSWLVRDSNNNYIAVGLETNKKLLAIASIYKSYQKELQRQRLYDYDDMILHAVRSLESNKDLRYRLQEQYMYILLDEFQDTNQAQLKIVKLLSDNPLFEEKPNVLAVGDDDQAIYAFQGADYSHMLAFREMFKDVRVITLTDNYRSHKDILHVAHNISGQIENRLHHHMKDVTKLLRANNKTLPVRAKLERHEFKSDVAEYSWIAKQIKHLIKQGVRPHDIAVLAPKHRFLEPLIPYLTKARIPVRYEKRENVLEDPHITQLLRMSQQIINLRDNNFKEAASLWPEILSYDFWQLSENLIWQLSWQASDKQQDWTNLLTRNTQTKQIALYFIKLSRLISTESLETMLDLLIGTTPLPGTPKRPYVSPFYEFHFSKKARTSNLRSFWSLLSNLTVLRQHLREYRRSEDRVLMLSDLVDFSTQHKSAGIKILNTSPYHESAEAVQVMTAYKAKGLEFGHVFIISCTDEVWGSKASSQSLRVPLPPNLKFVRYEGTNNDERLRLFFVALTRAKQGLYITNYQYNFANKPANRLKFLNETESGNKAISTLLPKNSQLIKQEDSKGKLTEEEISSYWHLRHLAATNQPKLESLLKHRLDTYQLAPTHLNTFTDLIYGGPQDFFLTTILKFPKAPTVDGEFGNAIHETLEWAHRMLRQTSKLPSRTAIIETFEQQLKAKYLNARDSKLLLSRGELALKAFLKARAKTFRASDEHEFRFANQGIFVGAAHLTGKIDKLVIDRKKREIKIVDYKTGEAFSKWSSNAKLHKYRQQLYFYKLLVEGSYEFADYTASEASLEFIEPDRSGNIVELSLSFDPKEVARLKTLLQNVWKHILTLNFPETRHYSNDVAGIMKFEEDLISGEI